MSNTTQASTNSKSIISVKHLVVCAVAIALSFVTSYIQLIKMPFGGSVTLCSMLFICLIGYWYGLKLGIATGFAYGILQFLQEPYFLNVVQLCTDYLLAFAALGLTGVWKDKKNGLIKGYILAITVRGLFHVLGGYMFWMDYMPDNFPKSLSMLYPIVYNYSYILLEGLFTVIILSLPPVKKALQTVNKTVL